MIKDQLIIWSDVIKINGLPIIHTKIMIPAMRSRMVHRLHLINKIERGLNRGFILISAPPGYGKTTLVAEWAQQSKTPVAWLSLDAQDNDLLVINRYLAAFIEGFFPSLKINSASFPPAGNSEEEFHALLVAIINACSELDSEFTLVLDDYHVIQNPKVHEGLLFTLEHLPQHLHLVIITRSDPPFPLARLRANNHVLELHATDLMFSPSEAEEFLNQTMQLHLSENQIALLNSQTEGWITGLQMAALSQNDSAGLSPTGAELPSNSNFIQQYITEEIFSRQPPQVQEFLLRTSVLDNLSAPLCDFLLDSEKNKIDSQKMIRNLDHSNLLITALDNEGKWFRYHPLFNEVLRRLMAEQHPGEIAALHVRASEWCDRNGLFEEALTHSLACNDYPRTIKLLEKYSLATLQHGDILDLLHWLRKVPAEFISTSPLLCLIYAWGLILSFELDSGELWIEKAHALLDRIEQSQKDFPNTAELRGGIYAVHSILAAARGEGERAIELSKQALNLLPEANSFSHCFALLDQGVTFSLNGELEKAIDTLQETIRISQASGNWIVMMIARSNLGDVLINRGELSRAMTLFKQSLAFAAPANGKSTGFEGLLYIEMGEIYLIRNQLTEASESLQRGVALSSAWLPMLYELDAHLHLAHLLHSQGDYAGSITQIRQAREIAEISQGSLDDLVLDAFEAKFSLLRGETSPALNWAQKNHLLDPAAANLFNNVPFSILLAIQLLLARLLLVLGQQEKDPQRFDQARTLLVKLIEHLKATECIDSQIEAYIQLALIDLECGNSDDMLANLQQALLMAEPEEFRQVFLDEGLPMARLLTRYLAYLKHNKIVSILPTRNFVTDLLFRLTGKDSDFDQTVPVPNQGKDAFSTPIELLTARELEVLKLAAGGRTNQEIAQELHLSINTVKRHLNNIFLKLGASTRTQAIAVAHQQGWIH